jgi:hypothetical protein
MTDSINKFFNEFTTMSDEKLESWINENAPIGSQASNLAIAELTRRYVKDTKNAIFELNSAIEDFSLSSKQYSIKIVCLTWALVILTIVLLILTGVMAFKLQ